jgi:hypothetical protein
MKNIYLIIFSLFFISFVFCSENEKYIFIRGSLSEGNEYKYKIEDKISFNVPGIGYIQYGSFFNSAIKVLSKEGAFHKLQATLTDMKTDNKIGNMEVMNYYWLGMNDIPCYLYIDSDGWIDHIEPSKKEHGYLKDGFEQAYINSRKPNYFDPFGMIQHNITPKAVGESWITTFDSVKILINLGSPVSYASGKNTYTLNKVKVKRGRKIAYISSVQELNMDNRIMVDIAGVEKYIVGKSKGIINIKIQWDIEAGVFLYERVVGTSDGDFEMDGEHFTTRFDSQNILRRVE